MVKKKESINKKTILCVFLIILVIVVIAALFVLKTFIKKPALSPLIDSNLVAEYWFENDRHDYSIYGNDGICPVGNCPYYLEGKKGQSVFFDGADDYINISHNEPINLKNNFTISLWIDIDDSTTGYIFTKGNFTCCNQKGTSLRYNPATKKLELFIIDWPLMSAGFVIPNVLEDGWHHAALVFDGTNASVYIDGYLGRTMEFSGSIENINSLTLGYKPGDEAFFRGSLDEVQVYKRALSQAEIASLYNSDLNNYQNRFANLSKGSYVFKAYTQDLEGNLNETETRTITLIDIPVNPPNPPGPGGGGGNNNGGGGTTTPSCKSNWTCEWAPCTNSIQTKLCRDKNVCSSLSGRPAEHGETKACSVEADCIDNDKDGYGEGEDCLGNDLEDNDSSIQSTRRQEIKT